MPRGIAKIFFKKGYLVSLSSLHPAEADSTALIALHHFHCFRVDWQLLKRSSAIMKPPQVQETILVITLF